METFHGRERPGRVRFGPFEIDVQNRGLTHSGEKVKLQDKPFQILMLLVAEPGKLVTREELRRSLWPANTFVDFEAGLNTAIRKLRDALQDEAKAPRFVETVQRYGYRFIAPLGAVVSGQENPEATAGVAPTSPGRVRFLLALAGISAAVALLLLLWP